MIMNTPEIYTTEQIKKWDTNRQISRQGRDYWTPARPYNTEYLRLFTRIKLAYMVFTGKCDALQWIEK